MIDIDGDSEVSTKELDVISGIVHAHQCENCKTSLELLRQTNPTQYTLSLVGKKKGDKILKKDFKILSAVVPYPIWHGRVLPLLREREITRLTNLQQANK